MTFLQNIATRLKHMGKSGLRDRCRLQLESLEERQLMAIDLVGGTLEVSGTSRSDVITVEEVTDSIGGGKWGIEPFAVPMIEARIESPWGTVRESARFFPSLVESLRIQGMAGHDRIVNETSLPAHIDGGTGRDNIRGGMGRDVIYGGPDRDTANGWGGVDFVYGNAGNDTLSGGNGTDWIIGGGGNDLLYGNFGGDLLFGQGGDDTLRGGAEDDRLWGGSGTDQLEGQGGHDRLRGGPDDDLLEGGNGNDWLRGEAGNDTLHGDRHNDTLIGGANDDELVGGRGNDLLAGRSGNDTLRGGYEDDTLRGDSGNDNLYGGYGSDQLYGGDGNDGLYGGNDPDVLDGEAGSDRYLIHKDEPGTGDRVDGFRGADDARIEFHNGGRSRHCGGKYDAGEFRQSEIELIDEALAALHARTGNDELLEKAGNHRIKFYRHGAYISGDSWAGCNVDYKVRDKKDKIHLSNDAFTAGEDAAIQVTLHEVGHNWDNENPEWGDFKRLSGWRSSNPRSEDYQISGNGNWWHLASAAFASGYAMNSPKEDFAESFAAYFSQQLGRPFAGGGAAAIPEKIAFLDRFFDDLASRT